MRRHNVLLICLLLTLPMLAGCTGTSNSLTSQAGEDNGDGETGETVVNNIYNNYYNNTTNEVHNHYNNSTTTEDHSHYYTIYNNTTTTIQETPEMIALSGMVDGAALTGSTVWYLEATINTTAGEMVQIVEAEITSNQTTYMKIDSECSGDLWFSTNKLSTNDIVSETWGKYMPGSAEDCTHSILISDDWVDGESEVPIYWSLVYSVLPVTVA